MVAVSLLAAWLAMSALGVMVLSALRRAAAIRDVESEIEPGWQHDPAAQADGMRSKAPLTFAEGPR